MNKGLGCFGHQFFFPVGDNFGASSPHMKRKEGERGEIQYCRDSA